ncbi:MAG: hypothetical protein JO297_14495 [Nitrososphaeraceae archaeon]|nr:hypothetical protein [Nitrososphaeraceae archaeon]
MGTKEIIKDCKAKKRDPKMDMDAILANFYMQHPQSTLGNVKMLMIHYHIR